VNKVYFTSLGKYLLWNTIVWCAVMAFTNGGYTIGSFLVSTTIAVIFHKAFVWQKK